MRNFFIFCLFFYGIASDCSTEKLVSIVQKQKNNSAVSLFEFIDHNRSIAHLSSWSAFFRINLPFAFFTVGLCYTKKQLGMWLKKYNGGFCTTYLRSLCSDALLTTAATKLFAVGLAKAVPNIHAIPQDTLTRYFEEEGKCISALVGNGISLVTLAQQWYEKKRFALSAISLGATVSFSLIQHRIEKAINERKLENAYQQEGIFSALVRYYSNCRTTIVQQSSMTRIGNFFYFFTISPAKELARIPTMLFSQLLRCCMEVTPLEIVSTESVFSSLYFEYIPLYKQYIKNKRSVDSTQERIKKGDETGIVDNIEKELRSDYEQYSNESNKEIPLTFIRPEFLFLSTKKESSKGGKETITFTNDLINNELINKNPMGGVQQLVFNNDCIVPVFLDDDAKETTNFLSKKVNYDRKEYYKKEIEELKKYDTSKATKVYGKGAEEFTSNAASYFSISYNEFFVALGRRVRELYRKGRVFLSLLDPISGDELCQFSPVYYHYLLNRKEENADDLFGLGLAAFLSRIRNQAQYISCFNVNTPVTEEGNVIKSFAPSLFLASDKEVGGNAFLIEKMIAYAKMLSNRHKCLTYCTLVRSLLSSGEAEQFIVHSFIGNYKWQKLSNESSIGTIIVPHLYPTSLFLERYYKSLYGNEAIPYAVSIEYYALEKEDVGFLQDKEVLTIAKVMPKKKRTYFVPGTKKENTTIVPTFLCALYGCGVGDKEIDDMVNQWKSMKFSDFFTKYILPDLSIVYNAENHAMYAGGEREDILSCCAKLEGSFFSPMRAYAEKPYVTEKERLPMALGYVLLNTNSKPGEKKGITVCSETSFPKGNEFFAQQFFLLFSFYHVVPAGSFFTENDSYGLIPDISDAKGIVHAFKRDNNKVIAEKLLKITSTVLCGDVEGLSNKKKEKAFSVKWTCQ